MTAYKEYPVQLKSVTQMFGIVTEPLRSKKSNSSPAVVFLNAGLLHRVGPNRLYVIIARDLSTKGVTSLRFDYSGIGDSSLRTDCLSYEQSVIEETGLFLDYLQNTQGFAKFVLIGICSGADNGLRVAVQDKRVIGCVSIDPLTKPTLTHYWRSYLRRAISLQSWKDLVSGRSDIIKKLQKAKDVQNTPDDIELSRPEDFSTVEALSALKSILERNARVCLVYSGGPSYYNYLENYKHELHSLQKNDNFTLIFFKHADHTFTLLYYQQALMQAITEWLSFVNEKRCA